MTKIININNFISITIVIFLLFIPLVVNGADDIGDSNKDEIKNPFYDYRKTDVGNEESSETENDNTENKEEKNDEEVEKLVNDLFKEENEKQSEDKSKEEEIFEVKTGYQNTETTNKIIEIKNKRIEPNFYWQGLISAQGRYKILLDYENESHLLSVGDKLNGYQVININSAKVTLAKDNYIYYLNMRGE